MFEQLTTPEKRDVLLASRVRYGSEFSVPRQRAVERMIMNALATARDDQFLSASDVIDLFKEVGKLPTLRLPKIEAGLENLAASGDAERTLDAGIRKYRLSDNARKETRSDADEASRRLDRVLRLLYKGWTNGEDPTQLRAFFLTVVCEAFSKLGSLWISYVSGRPLRAEIDLEKLEKSIDFKLKQFKVSERTRSDIKRRTVYFFQDNSDPDFNSFKFSLGQSLYVAELLGMDGRDLLSEETFSDGRLYLDSSVIIPALLTQSRHHRVFHELRKVCQRLRVELLITRPTLDEVRRVAADQQKLSHLYDSVPDRLENSIKGDFFQTYVALKKSEPNATVGQVFAPFEQLSDTLRDLNIEVVDDEKFEQFSGEADFVRIRDSMQAVSVEVRKRPKTENALTHDAQVFKHLRGLGTRPDDKLWLVTRDLSLPAAWNKIEPHGVKVRCFLLDGLLQSMAPFLASEEALNDFSEMFAQAVSAQFLPQGRIFDIDDFMLFQDLEIDCKDLPEDHLEEALLRVKTNVLKGASYRHENLEASTYELRRVFSNRHDKLEGWSKDRERLEGTVSKLEAALRDQETRHGVEMKSLQEEHQSTIAQINAEHDKEVTEFESRVRALEREAGQRKEKRETRILAAKQILSYCILAVTLFFTTRLTLRYGEGSNWALKVASLSIFYGVAFLFWLLLSKLLLFRNQKLKDILPAWAEIKELW